MRSSFLKAWYRLSQTKKPTMNSMATMGTLSGFLTMSAKFGSSMETATKTAAATPPTRATRGVHSRFTRRDRKKPMATNVMNSSGLVRKLTTSLRKSTAAMAYAAHTGPEIPPSLRTRQKWTAIRMPATSGMPTQCRT